MPSIKSLAALTVAVLMTAIVSACSQQSESSASPTSRATVHATVDEKSGAITLPLDKFMPSLDEVNRLDYAMNLVLDDCMRGKHLAFPPIDTRRMATRPDRRYGVWRMADAVRYGYQLPPDDPIRKQFMANNGGQQAPGWMDASLDCGKQPAATALRVTTPEGPAAEELQLGEDEDVMDGAPARAIRKQWVQCLGTAHIDAPKDQRWIDAGWMRADLQTQIRIAVADVRCKESQHTVQQMADLEATAQQVVVEQHEAELADRRGELDQHLKVAEKVIAAHGG